MKNNLKIKLKNKNSNVLSYENNTLTLKNGGEFTVIVEAYEKKLSQISEKIEQREKRGSTLVDEHAHYKSLTDAQKKKYSQMVKEYNNGTPIDYTKKQKNEETSYEDVRWIWSIVNSNLQFKTIDNNVSIIKGQPEKTFHFPEFLEGGGFCYLEAYHANTLVTLANSPGVGLLVQSIGIPEILAVEWRQYNENGNGAEIPNGTVLPLGSSVQLHIFTQGLYGQEIEIQLMDNDSLVEKAFDDILPPIDKKETQVKKGEYPPMPTEDGKKIFVREVRSYQLQKESIPTNAKIGNLIIEKDNEDFSTIFIQKCVVDVFIDPFWAAKHFGGESEMEIYAQIRHANTKEYTAFIKDFVKTSKHEIASPLTPVGNKPVLVGEVETNFQRFQPCQYREILIEYEEKNELQSIEIFKENIGLSQNPNLEIGIIVGSDPKKFSLKVDDKADTKECLFHGKPNDHNKNIFTYDASNLPKNVAITSHLPKSIEGTAFFDYDEHNIFNYIWPTKPVNSHLSNIVIHSNTCRYQNNINITIYPDVVWSLAFTFALKNPLAYTYSAGKDNKNTIKGDVIYTEAHKKAFNSGNDRNKLRQGKSIDGEFLLSLKGKYNKIDDSVPIRYVNELEYGEKIANKISYFLDKLLLLKKIAQNAKEATGGSAKKSNIIGDKPFSFEIQSPKIGVAIDWKAEKTTEGEYKEQICNTGVLKLVFDPLIGAEFTINMLSAAAKINPVVLAIKSAVDIGLDALGGYIKLDAVFYGTLNITIETLKLNSLEGFKITDKQPKIDGKMGIKVVFELKIKGSTNVSKFIPKLDFDASARAELHAYFGGTALIKADKEGVFADITVKFSGLIFSAVGEIKVGRFKSTPFKVSPMTMWDSEQKPLGKIYLI